MQFGEDKWLMERFKNEPPGYAAEVGASNGVNLSNTYALEKNGWNVVCIEPNPLYEPDLKRYRNLSIITACGAENVDSQEFSIYATVAIDGDFGPVTHYMAASSLRPTKRIVDVAKCGLEFDKPYHRIKVPVRTLDWCLETVEFPRCDFVSIDTEGTELDVLKGFDPKRWYTKVVIIENNFDEDDTRAVMRGNGFKMVSRLGVNDIWENGV